jgi:hypothetical protein
MPQLVISVTHSAIRVTALLRVAPSGLVGASEPVPAAGSPVFGTGPGVDGS